MGFSEDRAQGRYESRYVLAAENPYILWDAITDWKRSCGQAGRIPVDVFRAPKIDFDRLLDIGATIPMFGEQRLVIIHELHRLTASQQTRLETVLKRFGPTTKVVLTAAKLDKRKRLYKFLREWGSIEEFPRIYENKLAGWAHRIAGEFGWKLSTPAANLLVSTYGDDLFSVRQTIERVTLFLGKPRRIEVTDVETALVGEGAHTVFLLLETIARGDLSHAFDIVRTLFSGEQYPATWLAALSSLLQRLLKLAEANEPDDYQAARLTGINHFFIAKSRRQVDHFGRLGLCAAIGACFETEWAIKTSQLSPRLGWELLVYRLSSRTRLTGPPLFDLESPKNRE